MAQVAHEKQGERDEQQREQEPQQAGADERPERRPIDRGGSVDLDLGEDLARRRIVQVVVVGPIRVDPLDRAIRAEIEAESTHTEPGVQFVGGRVDPDAQVGRFLENAPQIARPIEVESTLSARTVRSEVQKISDGAYGGRTLVVLGVEQCEGPGLAHAGVRHVCRVEIVVVMKEVFANRRGPRVRARGRRIIRARPIR